VKFGLNALQVPPHQLAEVARAAEEAGYESLWMPDHLVFASQTASRYPYNADGSSPVGPDTPFPDPLVSLAAAAATTSRLKLGTAVYVLPLRNPVVSAKLAATVDVVSGGRLLFGLGVGWMAEEFALSGEDFAARVARAEECVQVMKSLWAGGASDFRGEYYDVRGAHQAPKPVQQPHPPLIFGGETEAALRRAARLGDGWIGMRHTPDSARAVIEKLRAHRERAGKADAGFEITTLGGPAPDAETVRALEAAGVHRLNVYPFGKSGSPVDNLHRYAEEVVTRV
jgi:probable F420-dependent oxidoreductase